MITLTQDTDGFIRMERRFPASASVGITFNDGSTEVFTGAQVNQAYDDAVADFRAKNNLDAKGFSRAPKKAFAGTGKISFVPVRPGLAGPA